MSSELDRILKPKKVRKMDLWGGRDYPFYSYKQTIKSSVMVSKCVGVFHYDEHTWTEPETRYGKDDKPCGVNKNEDRIQDSCWGVSNYEHHVKGTLPGN